ncbi:MAG: hypothetical protein LAT67_05145 [Balneolales bacterium]|nr:hypothetical protein [Balneolales bacterium]
MSNITPFPLRLLRQFADSIDPDMVFPTLDAMNDYLASPRRYAGQLVSCIETETIFLLNSARTTWIEILPGIPDVPDDGNAYIRVHGEWQVFQLPEQNDPSSWEEILGTNNIQPKDNKKVPISALAGLTELLEGYEQAFTKRSGFNKDFGDQEGTVTQGNDPRLSNSREWTAPTVTEVEVVQGTSTERRAWSVVRVREAIAAWVNSVKIKIEDVTGLSGILNSKADKTEIPDTSSFENATQLDQRDAANRNRGNHTGTQPASTVTGLGAVATTNSYDDLDNKPNLSEFENTSALNQRDNANRNRENHTGTQDISTIAGLAAALASKVEKIEGKGLSQEDFTTEFKELLENFEENGGPEITPELIKEKYEENEDTNAFDDAAKLKLENIEPEAEKNPIWINEAIPPLPVGGYSNTEPATPPEGLSVIAAIEKFLFPPLPPSINSFTRSPSQFEFQDDDVSVTLSWNTNAVTAGATIANVRIEFRRNNSGSWTNLHNASTQTGSFVHSDIPNSNNHSINYRLIVTDSAGNTATSSVISVNFKSYQTPTISFPNFSPLSREVGELDATITGTITRRSPNIALQSYQLEVRLNGGSWQNLGDSVTITDGNSAALTPVEYTAPATTGGDVVTSVQFSIRITDQQGQGSRLTSNTITGSRKLFYEPVQSETLPDIRDLEFSILNPNAGTQFTINIPAGAQIVAFAYPASIRDVSQVIFVQGGNVDVKGAFGSPDIESIADAKGQNDIDYKVYTFTPVEPFSSAVTYNVTI